MPSKAAASEEALTAGGQADSPPLSKVHRASGESSGSSYQDTRVHLLTFSVGWPCQHSLIRKELLSTNSYGLSVGGDENVLELCISDGCITL